MQVIVYTEPETGNEYTSLPDPWKGKCPTPSHNQRFTANLS